MAKTKNDEAYERGVKDGKEGNILDDFSHSISEGFSTTKEEKTYDKGYEWGADHRYDSDNSSSSDSDSSSGGGSSGDSGCYLTTACISAKGLPDNCLELRTLRNFRDNQLAQTLQGRRDIKEYYSVAPEIVQAINERTNSEEIWNKVYGEIQKAVSLVLKENFNEAYEHYKNLTSNLKKKFLD